MVVTCQVNDEVLLLVSTVACEDRSRIQFLRSHFLELIRQDNQAVAHLDSRYETYASITVLNIHIRSLHLMYDSGGGEAYQELTVDEALTAVDSVYALRRICRDRSVRTYVRTVFRTRNRLDRALVVTSYRDQVLRLNQARATIYPSGIDIECQVAVRLLGVPDTGVANLLVAQVLVPLIHQVLTAGLLNEYQAIGRVIDVLAQSGVVEVTVQRRVVRSDSERGCTSLA